MSDPLTDVVQLLDPSADFSKLVDASGPWSVRRTEQGRPFFCVLLQGSSRLETNGAPLIDLQAGDFLMLPAAQDFTMSAGSLSLDQVEEMKPVRQAEGHFRLGPSEMSITARLLIGYCRFRSPDANLLLSLLPQVIHVRDDPRLTSLVQLIADETAAARPGRDVVVARLLEVTLIEALRATSGATAPSGLMRGLSDTRLSTAIQKIHEEPAHPWTIRDLAKEAGMSRTVFFERFKAVVGISPIEHLTAWRMALAKRMLNEDRKISEIAERVGYGSAGAFGTAFRRSVGVSPARYATQVRPHVGVIEETHRAPLRLPISPR